MEIGYNRITPREPLWWESNEFTQEEWVFLCTLFGQDPNHAQIIQIIDYAVESFVIERKVDDFCSKEESIFFE